MRIIYAAAAVLPEQRFDSFVVLLPAATVVTTLRKLLPLVTPSLNNAGSNTPSIVVRTLLDANVRQEVVDTLQGNGYRQAKAEEESVREVL